MILKGTGGLRVPRVPGKKGTFHPTMLPNSSRSKQSRKFFFSSYINKKYIIYTKVFCPNFILKSTHKTHIAPLFHSISCKHAFHVMFHETNSFSSFFPIHFPCDHHFLRVFRVQSNQAFIHIFFLWAKFST